MGKRKSFPQNMPSFDMMINPTLQAIKELGGSATINEIYNKVIEIMQLPDDIIEILHSDKSSQSEIEYRLAWSRTYLSKYRVISNPSRGVWVTNPEYKDETCIDVEKCVASVRNMFTKKTSDINLDDEDLENDGVEIPEEVKSWREKVHEILLKMNPYAFERLSMRLLRVSGFTDVEVTKKSNDGGIDGFGTFKINDMFSIKVAFQCKRYAGSVPVSDIRDFRGSLTTDVEKAIFITTGAFPPSVKNEAKSAGKFQIDLIDGEELIKILKEKKMGITPKIEYDVDENFFNTI